MRTLKLLANVNTENDDNNKVLVENNVLTNRDSNSWMFDNNSSTSNNSQARICTFNNSSSSSSSSSSTFPSSASTYDQRTAHIWDYDIVQLHMELQCQCHDIAAVEEICFDFQRKTATYSEPDFRVNMSIADTSFPLARHVVGPQNNRTLTVLGWTDDTSILNATLYPDHVQKNTPQFKTALFNIGRIWLGAATILPPRHIHDLDDTYIQDQDNFSTFRPKCTRYNPLGAPGSYVSRKKQLKSQKLYRDRSQPQATSVTDPVPSSTTADDNAPAYDGPDLTPVKFRISTLWSNITGR